MSESTNENNEQGEGQAPPDPVAMATELAAARAQLAEFAAWKTQQEQAETEAKRARMTEAQKLAADREALTAKEKALKDRARGDVLAKLGVLDKFHAIAPDVDPADPAGAKALEDWAKANPELVKPRSSDSQPYNAPQGSSLAKLLTGGVKNSIINPRRAAELLSRSK